MMNLKKNKQEQKIRKLEKEEMVKITGGNSVIKRWINGELVWIRV